MPGRVLSPFATLVAASAVITGTCLTAGCGRAASDIQASALSTPTPTPDASDSPGMAGANAVTRGAYLVAVSGCHDCHTPLKMGPKGPEPDMALMLSGHPAGLKLPPPPQSTGAWAWHGNATNTAFAGPWGISYARNLTSDEETGIGSWTEQVFVRAIKTGKHLGVGRPIMPPMPWPAYSQMTEDDLKAIFAYLKTVPAKQNRAPESVVAPAPHS